MVETSSDDILIEYVKEKDNLRLDLKSKEAEIQKYKAKVYDLHEQIKQLQEANAELVAEKAALLSNQQAANKLNVPRPRTAAGSRSPMLGRPKTAGRGRQPAKSTSNNQPKKPPTSTATVETKSDSTHLDPPIDPRKEIVERLAFLENVGEKFPELKLSVIFASEKFFKEGDINGDGTIDYDELEKLLTKQGHLYTDKELKEIMTQIDVDKTGSIDIMEYLAVMERVQQRKRVNLPQALTRSSACIVQ